MPSARLPPTLRQLSGGAYLAGILLLAAGVVFALGRHLDDHFRRELSDRGRALVERLAEDSRLALIQSESDSLRPRLEIALADPNVAGIVVATARGAALASAGPNPLPTGEIPAAGAMGNAIRIVETERALTLVAAVRPNSLSDDYFARGTAGAAAEPDAPLGLVALTLTKAKLRADLRAINRHVLAVMGAGALLATLLALVALDRLTRPIKHLARIMADPETVRHLRRVEVRGVREARVIATAYNDLIARVAASRDDLARQVEEAVREVRRQNAELVVEREKAEAASRVKSQFVANMSHEIRTPMHGFSGFLDMLGETPLTPLQKSHWRLLKHSMTNLLVVINKILDFSRLEAGKIELRPQPFDLRKTLDNAVQLFAPNARAKGLKLLLAVEDNIPERVIGDRQHLTQILCNLIDNAIKFTRRGSVRVSAQAAPGPDPSRCLCRLSVQDTGIGIPETHRQKIFESFNQVDSSTTREQGGTGLGLAICRHLIDLMGGRIKVESEEGIGSTFRVEVPLVPTDEAPADEELSPDPPPGAETIAERPVVEDVLSERNLENRPRPGSKRVLVVDDNPTNLALAKAILHGLNAEVVLADSGQAALDACRWHRFNLIVMDLMMPGMGGLEVTRRIRRWAVNPNRDIPIIGMTGTASEQRAQHWKEVGMSECFVKPQSPAVMRAVFRKWGIA